MLVVLSHSLWLHEKENPHRKAADQTVHRVEVRIQTVNQRWNRPLIVGVGEQNQLFVDEVIVGEVSGLTSIQVLLKKPSNKDEYTYFNQQSNVSLEWF